MKNKIFVKNLSKETTESMLREFLSKHGVIGNVSIFEETKFDNPCAFALVEINSEDEANKIIGTLNGKNLDGKEVYIIKANSIKIPNKPIK